jgi:hypothetical protein
MHPLTFSMLFSLATADQLINNNWYGKSVQRIAYSGVGGGGSYSRIISMNSNAGTCASAPQPFSGPLAPLDEDVSILAHSNLSVIFFYNSSIRKFVHLLFHSTITHSNPFSSRFVSLYT